MLLLTEVMCNVATLFLNIAFMFSSSITSSLSFHHDMTMGCEPLTEHWKATNPPMRELRFSIFLVKVGGSGRQRKSCKIYNRTAFF